MSLLTIFVAVDDRGVGYVLSWQGHPPQVECMRNEVENTGRDCDDLLLDDHPKVPGVYRFDGKLTYRIWDEDAEPAFEGVWTHLSGVGEHSPLEALRIQAAAEVHEALRRGDAWPVNPETLLDALDPSWRQCEQRKDAPCP